MLVMTRLGGRNPIAFSSARAGYLNQGNKKGASNPVLEPAVFIYLFKINFNVFSPSLCSLSLPVSLFYAISA